MMSVTGPQLLRSVVHVLKTLVVQLMIQEEIVPKRGVSSLPAAHAQTADEGYVYFRK